MDAGFLDTLVQTYVTAFQQGFGMLHALSLGLLGLVGGVAWGANLIHVIQAGMPLGGILAQLCLVLTSFAVHVLLITNMYSWAFGFFDLFTRWGASITGGAFSAEQFLSPSTVWTIGFTVSRPLIDFVMDMGALAVVKNIGPIFIALIAVLVIILAFLWVTKDIMLTILEFHLAVMIAPILFPWAILSHTAELAAFVISWFFAGCLRALLIIATVGIGIPLMEGLIPTFTAGGDPTLYSSLVMLGSSLMFLFIVNEVAKRAATVGGRGYALGLPGAALVPPHVVNAALTLVGGAAGRVIAGVSNQVQARRRGNTT
jgi:type IV secretion system protein TrbL